VCRVVAGNFRPPPTVSAGGTPRAINRTKRGRLRGCRTTASNWALRPLQPPRGVGAGWGGGTWGGPVHTVHGRFFRKRVGFQGRGVTPFGDGVLILLILLGGSKPGSPKSLRNLALSGAGGKGPGFPPQKFRPSVGHAKKGGKCDADPDSGAHLCFPGPRGVRGAGRGAVFLASGEGL